MSAVTNMNFADALSGLNFQYCAIPTAIRMAILPAAILTANAAGE
jgi:hypothetical protein